MDEDVNEIAGSVEDQMAASAFELGALTKSAKYADCLYAGGDAGTDVDGGISHHQARTGGHTDLSCGPENRGGVRFGAAAGSGGCYAGEVRTDARCAEDIEGASLFARRDQTEREIRSEGVQSILYAWDKLDVVGWVLPAQFVENGERGSEEFVKR
jgi:hypothetical protein